jgi:hypothetical protein
MIDLGDGGNYPDGITDYDIDMSFIDYESDNKEEFENESIVDA